MFKWSPAVDHPMVKRWYFMNEYFSWFLIRDKFNVWNVNKAGFAELLPHTTRATIEGIAGS